LNEKLSASPIPLLPFAAQVGIAGIVVTIVPFNQRNEFVGERLKLANPLLEWNEASVHNYGF
jgi:hypothetical protein